MTLLPPGESGTCKELVALFLDEIGDIAAPLLVKLLRTLQVGQFARVGENELLDLDVRIVAATNRNLASLVERQIPPLSLLPRHRDRDTAAAPS